MQSMIDNVQAAPPAGSKGFHFIDPKVFNLMWCRNCQQDVPALARGINSPLVCPRCEEDLPVVTVATSPTVCGEISDVGIALDSYQQSPANGPSFDQLPLEMLAQEQRQLSRIAQKLGPIRRQKQLQQGVAQSELSGSGMTGRDSMSSISQPSLRIDWAHSVSPTAIKTREKRMETPVSERSDARVAAVGYQARSQPSRTTSSWGLSMLLFGGVFSLTCGISLLVHATVTGLGTTGLGASMPGDFIWQGGLTFTLAGEGMLIAGLTGMAIRLWRNGRRVNHQLQGVDRQLAELQYQYQSDAQRGIQTSTSSAYYDHFAQGISSPILLANLRGGLDQLAKRMN
jgi:hypothetical protein